MICQAKEDIDLEVAAPQAPATIEDAGAAVLHETGAEEKPAAGPTEEELEAAVMKAEKARAEAEEVEAGNTKIKKLPPV